MAVMVALSVTLNLAPNPGFEADLPHFGGWYPLGSDIERRELKGLNIDASCSHSGHRSLRVDVGEAKGLTSLPLRLDEDVAKVTVSLWVRGPNAGSLRLGVRWFNGRKEMIGEDLTEPVQGIRDWVKLELSDTRRPDEAKRASIIVRADGGTFWVDDVYLSFSFPRRLSLLVNQLGYDPLSRKRVVLQSSEAMGDRLTFSVVSSDGKTALEGTLKPMGKMEAWDMWYWVGDFSELSEPGSYRVKVVASGRELTSPEFSIAPGIALERTGELAYRFFYCQRCGTEVPGWHGPCHTDDGEFPDGLHRDVSGGWHDAGDYNKYNGYTPLAVYSLLYAYEAKPEFFGKLDRDGNGRPDILDEALWGAGWLRRMQDERTGRLWERVFSGYGYWGPPEGETDNIPGSGDDRPVAGAPDQGNHENELCAASFAMIGRLIPGEESYLRDAEKIWRNVSPNEMAPDRGLLAAIELFKSTGKGKYLEAARARVRKLLGGQLPDGRLRRSSDIVNEGMTAAALALFALNFHNDELVPEIVEALKRYAAHRSVISRNPFGVGMVYSDRGVEGFLHRYREPGAWHVGQNSQYLSDAWAMALSEKLGAGLAGYVQSQMDWILGLNPYGVSMFEGVGEVNPPVYHHRYNSIEGHPRGAVPGAVCNGIVRWAFYLDRPWFDMRKVGQGTPDYESNEPWLPHNAYWLLAVSSM